MKLETFLKWLSAEIFAVLGLLLGGMDGLLQALLVFMILDYLTGVANAFKDKTPNSRTGFWGILRKGLMLVVVIVAHVLDWLVLGGSSSMMRSGVIGFFLANEGLSILENVTKLGIPLPKKLKAILQQLKEKEDDDNEPNQERKDSHGKNY